MDPDETLQTLIALATHIVNRDVDAGDVDRLANGVLDLDGWLRNGGFLPADWSAGRCDATGRRWQGGR